MKKLFSYVLLMVTGSVIGQTNITTSTVSGTWTLVGSPYIVQIATNVAAGQVLTIQPGVVVRFQAETKLEITGQLIAAGTAVSPIIFEADDTTGWSDHTNTTGGWNGIHYHQFSGSGADNSKFDHCIVRDAKYGYSVSVSYTNAFTTERGLQILNSTFEHNHSGIGMYVAEAMVSINTYLPSDTVEINNCIMTNNFSTFGIVRTSNYFGGYTRILNSDLNNNHLGATIWGIWNSLVIENNLIHHNDMVNDNSPVKVSIGNIAIRGNKVYNNECDQLAAVGCRSGQVTIENNLICNNRQNDGGCGILGGGGGIHLSHNEAASFSDTYYIVRNNIIANNFSAYGGGGVYVYNARATISNNHIINNSTGSYGKAVLVLNTASEVNLKNNLFYSESVLGVVDTTNIIYILSANTLELDYNYLPSQYTGAVQTAFGFTLVGDTIHNVIGNAPGMIAPTADNDYTTSALTANFNLFPSSPCVDQGDTVGVFSSTIDYAGNNRINGTIDIGAYESDPLQGIDNPEITYSALGVYPNPVPVNGQFNVITPEPEGMLIIRDMTGRVIRQQVVTSENNAITLEHCSKGIYFMNFYGKRNSTGKLVVN